MDDFKVESLCAIAGQPGLYIPCNKLKNGNVVFENVTNGNRIQVNPRKASVTRFGDVTIYTDNGNIQLEKVFERLSAMDQVELSGFSDMEDNSKRLVMESVVPGYDKQKFKVYHMQKILLWYKDVSDAIDKLAGSYDDPYEDEDELTE